MLEATSPPGRRWASRKEAMVYARVGSTRMNELMQGRAFVAKKDGVKVIVCLDSVDLYYEALPDVGSIAPNTPAHG